MSTASTSVRDREVAYFSMEIAFESAIPTYAGGLGVLAGDTLRAAADLEIPMIGVSLVHRQGYFRQRLGPAGEQIEEADPVVLLDTTSRTTTWSWRR